MTDSLVHNCLLLADFTIDNLAGLLENDSESPALACSAGPFDAVSATLLDPKHDCWQHNPEFTIVWTLPNRVSSVFARARSFEQVDHEEALAEVDTFAKRLLAAADRSRFWLVPNWVLPPDERGYGLLNSRHGVGLGDLLARMNLRIAEALAPAKNIYVLDTHRWLTMAGRFACNPKLWYMGKVAFNNDVLTEAARDIKSAARALLEGPRKLLLLDLDDTLWGGIVGEVGVDGIRLGGHDPIGEAYVAFQHQVRALTNRGVILGIVSKNEETVALEAIRRHPEMVLTIDDFAGRRINWQDKARNVAELAEELNLGLQSTVFVDNSAAERDRVREALPEVLVPEWPIDPMHYVAALSGLRCFDSVSITAEDAGRTGLYAAERKREQAREEVSSVEDWLKSLNLHVTATPLSPVNRERTVQLLNKTNQMNLTTRRLTADELEQWLAEPGHDLLTVRVEDKFGDAGLTGIVSVTVDGDSAQVVDFVLSCRVFGRKVEETMVHLAVAMAARAGAKILRARWTPTPKNAPCKAFLDQSDLRDEGGGLFAWSVDETYPLPECITLICETLSH